MIRLMKYPVKMFFKKLLTTSFVGLILLSPVVGFAQNSPTSSTSSDTQSLQRLMMGEMATSSEPVSHGEVTIDIGIERRFSESPQAFAEVDITASQVFNSRRLQAFVRHLALTKHFEKMGVDDEKITATISGPADLLGFIPVSIAYDTTVAFSNGDIDDVSTEITSGWWTRLTRNQTSDAISEAIETTVENSQFLSVTQQKAVILETIVETISERK